MPQFELIHNQGPEDHLLMDSSRSYFKNLGYTRTSAFSMEIPRSCIRSRKECSRGSQSRDVESLTA